MRPIKITLSKDIPVIPWESVGKITSGISKKDITLFQSPKRFVFTYELFKRVIGKEKV